MIPDLHKDIQCHLWLGSFLFLQITGSDIRPQVKWAVNMVIVDGHLICLKGLVGMYELKYLVYHPSEK